MNKPTIYYDPEYNFHNGYHYHLIESSKNLINWKKASLTNFYEDCIWNDLNIDMRKSLFNHGYFKIKDKKNIIFSPHIFLENENPYIMELEAIEWLFADDYHHGVLTVPDWKVALFEKLVMKDNLKAILWWSQSAYNLFLEKFVPEYEISDSIVKRVNNISCVIPPLSPKIVGEQENLHGNNFLMVYNSKNWYRKGLDVVLKLFGYLSPKLDWKLHLVGGKVPEDLKYLFEPISPKIRIYGKIKQKCLFELMSKMDCLLFPSRADTFGTILAQAINANLFIIAGYGDKVYASKEALKNYSAAVLIENKKSSSEWNEIDENAFYEEIENFILGDVKVPKSKIDRFSYKKGRKKFMEIIKEI